MIGKEELYNEEHEELKVTDKRKFNPDGSLRDGVIIEDERADAPSEPSETPGGVILTQDSPQQDAPEGGLITEDADDAAPDDSEIPGADDPASFINFLSTLASQAAAALGALPHPVTGQRSVDLETGKYWIDVLVMLRDKTKGNLHPQEQNLFNGLLGDLQLQYVALTKASEEQLKKQAAQKFSASDILGKK